MQSRTKVINGFLLKAMMVGGRKFIVVMHESGLVLRSNEFRDLIVYLSETQVEGLDGFTILIGNVIVFHNCSAEIFDCP